MPHPKLRINRTLAGLLLMLAAGLQLCSPAAAEESPDIIIGGLIKPLEDNVRAFLSLSRETCETSQIIVRRQFARADNQARAALQALGYYEPQIDKVLNFDEDCWQAVFDIKPGKAVILSGVHIEIKGEAEEDPQFQRWRERLPLRKGNVLNQGVYDEVKQSLAELAGERGYFDAHFERSVLRVDPDSYSANAVLVYVSGPRYHISPVNYQQDTVRPELVKRFQTFETGAPYDREDIAELQLDLSASGYFGDVRVTPRLEDRKDQSVPLDVTLTPGKRRRYGAGLGATTDTGPRLRLEYRDRRVNGRGHQFGSRLQTALVESSITADYRIPLAQPDQEWLTFDGGFQIEDTDTRDSSTFLTGVRQAKKRRAEWLETRFLEFQRERFTVGSVDDITNLLMPGIGWTKTRADRPVFPRRGYRLNFQARAAVEGLISDLSFTQLVAGAKGIISLPFRARLLSRVDVGASLVDEFVEFPASLRFFAGGDNSVRGFGFETIGPRDANGDVIGGRNLLTTSIEYEQTVLGNWGFALFADGGNALDKFEDLDDLEIGVGMGIRWRSPIGPVRFDLARAVGDPNASVRFHFSMGPDF